MNKKREKNSNLWLARKETVKKEISVLLTKR
jgi:hypothetical protein